MDPDDGWKTPADIPDLVPVDLTMSSAENQGGKFLTFFLDEEEYGLEILRVREIIGLLPITAVPRTPDFVRGIVNLRGKVIPVLSLRRKFDMSDVEDTDHTCIIVVQSGDASIGMIVDRVSEVLDIAPGDIVDAPTLGAGLRTEYLLGIGRAGGRIRLLLDIDRVLSEGEHAELHALQSATAA